MSVFKDFWNFIQGKLIGQESVEVSAADFQNLVDKNKVHELELLEFALNAGINIVANMLSVAETRTFRDWGEFRGEQYYRWNYQPNMNQTANEFKHKLVWMLIYRNECLVIQNSRGDLVIADSYTHEAYGLKEDIFTDVTICQEGPDGVMHPLTLQKRYRMRDVLFYRLNNKNITDLLRIISQGYSDLLDTAIKKFYRSGGEKGTLTVDGNAPTGTYGMKEDGTPRTFGDVYQELMNRNFKDYFAANSAVLPLYKGFEYEIRNPEGTKKTTSEVKDVTDLTDEIFERVGNALGVPAALIKGDLADLSQALKTLIVLGVRPIAKVIETENNRKLYGQEVLAGNYQKIDTMSLLYAGMGDLSDDLAKMIGSSVWSVDEARVRIGEPPLNTDWSVKHWMTKNNTEVTMLGKEEKGGEKGEE